MDEDRAERRLTTVLAADVVGYSRLMAVDEAGTLASLKAIRRELFEPLTAEYRGRVVKLMGDGTLMEFASVVDAVKFAAEVQRAMALRNIGIPEDQSIAYRIGINIGDIIVEGDDIYGDGVNVAARLEGLAESGGICVSRPVHTQVKGKVDLAFKDLGEQEVKNIPESVQVFQVLLDRAAGPKEGASKTRAASNRQRLASITTGLLMSLLAIAGLIWWGSRTPEIEPASEANMAFPLPEKPSIAVLPFSNISEDQAQEYFADGMTEDLITDLSKISGLFVIARNSSFSYKGQQVKVRQVAEELGVRYVLEGSVRRVGNEVRINAQLIDATTGGHLWAERYDGTLDDVFDLQDKVIGSIVSALAVKLTDTEASGRETRKQTRDLEAHEYFLRGRQHLSRFTAEDSVKAKELFEKVIEIDPNHVEALTALGRLHYNEWQIWGKARDENLARALELGQQAASIDDDLAGPHLLLSQVYRFLRQQEESEREANKALALEPRDADTLAGLGDVLRWTGQAQEAIGLLRTAMRLDPFYPAWYEFYLGDALFQTGQYDEAITALKRGAERNPNYPAFHLFIAASYAMLGRDEEARAAAAEVLRINPSFTLRAYAAYVPYHNSAHLERDLKAFRKAGLPE